MIGAGHAGLAASRFLTDRSIDHLVLERGEVANSWRRERWDSLRLLTPNWQSRLPGHAYDGPDPDGYMSAGEVVAFIDRFARVSSAPVRTRTAVTSIRPAADGYDVATSSGEIRCRCVVLASGACNVASVPAIAAGVPPSIAQVTPFDYGNPDRLPEGGVLVVGGSATGVQLAAEIQQSGRPVTLSVGEHVRLPRTYRGRDVLWWMDASGLWNQRYDEIDDLTRARRLPSPQLVGTPERSTLDLNALTAMGVALVGRLAAIRDGRALFSGGLRNVFALADLKMERLLDHLRRVGAARPGAMPTSARPSASSPRASPRPRRCSSISAAARFAASSGRRGSTPTIVGCTCRCWTRRASSCTRAAWSRRPACMRWACRSCAAGSRRSSTASRTTRATSSITSVGIWPAQPAVEPRVPGGS